MPQDAPRASSVASPVDHGASANVPPRPTVPDRTGYAVSIGVALLLTFTGAFETMSVPFLHRLAYWLVVMISGALIGSAVTNVTYRWGRLAAYPFVEAPVIAVGIAVPLTLLVMGASSIAFGLRGYSLRGAAFMFLLVLAVSLLMVAINYLMVAQQRAGMALQAAGMAQAAPVEPDDPTDAVDMLPGHRFRARLPLHLQTARLFAVASEDHYVRVYCEGGEAMILLRLADAIAELADVPGAQTHRSWWVARDAVVEAKRSAGKAVLHLANDSVAPVSRSFLPVLAQQGWR